MSLGRSIIYRYPKEYTAYNYRKLSPWDFECMQIYRSTSLHEATIFNRIRWSISVFKCHGKFLDESDKMVLQIHEAIESAHAIIISLHDHPCLGYGCLCSKVQVDEQGTSPTAPYRSSRTRIFKKS